MEIKKEENLFRGTIALLIVTVTLLILIATLFLSTFVVNINKKWLLDQTHHNLVSLTNTLAEDYLSSADFLNENFTENKEPFQDFFQQLLQNKEISQVNAFNLDGSMVSSNSNYKLNENDRKNINLALSTGNVVSTQNQQVSGSQLMEIYVPIKKNGVIYGVIEIFHTLNDMNLHIGQAVNTIKILLLGTLSALALFVLFWSTFFYQKLKEKNKQLIQAQESFKKNIELKKLFISIMNHDLKHPLGIIKTAVSMVKEQDHSDQDKPHLKKIDEMVDLMLRMISDARIFSQLEDKEYTEKKMEIDLVLMINRIVNDFKHRDYGYKNIKINFNHSVKNHKISALPILENVVINLIDNAIKYSGDSPEVTVNLSESKENYLINVSDNGTGIPDKYKDKIFVKYKRLGNGEIEGSGLGLAIVKYIVELHNGRIWVEDNKIGGALFKVELPRNLE